MGIAQYKNAVTLLRTRIINTTDQHFQMRHILDFVLVQRAQKLSAIKFQM